MNAPTVLALLDLARPAAAWALLAAVLFLLALRFAARPPEVVIGTLALWNDAARVPAGKRARGPLPVWALVAAAGLLCGALAWLGLRAESDGAARTWICVVDRSPSMGLASGAGTRLEAALARATEWLADEAGSDDRVRWIAAGRPAVELGPDARPDAAWLSADPAGAEPRWAEHDHAGTLWITDRTPAVAPTRAGVFASGGAAVAGAVAADGRETVLWDGAALARTPAERVLAVRIVEPAGGALPAVLARVLAAWCEARGHALVRDESRAPETETVLVVERAPGTTAEAPLELARDGWRAQGHGADIAVYAAADDRDEDWLHGRAASGATPCVVRAGPGRIRIGLAELTEPEGDPALFALSFARLFDRCALAPAGVVPLAERLAAGGPLARGGEPPPGSMEPGRALGPRLDAALALAMALSAVVALVLRARV